MFAFPTANPLQLFYSTDTVNMKPLLLFSTGQTGRYILILKRRETERQLVADDCPLQHLAQLGQLAAEVQFILRWKGPNHSDGQDRPTRERLPLPRPVPESLKHRVPQKSLTFNLGTSTFPRRTKSKRVRSPSPRASPEPRASPVSFLDPPNSVNVIPSYSFKEEVFRQVLQKQKMLQDLEIQLEALERETEVWERERSSAVVPGMTLDLTDLLEELEQQQRLNEEELLHEQRWEDDLQEEIGREQGMFSNLFTFSTFFKLVTLSYDISKTDHVNTVINRYAQTSTSDTVISG